jgi:hypothetical protein
MAHIASGRSLLLSAFALCILFESVAIREYEALEGGVAVQIKGPHPWTRRTRLKVPSGFESIFADAHSRDKPGTYFLFVIFYLPFVICDLVAL